MNASVKAAFTSHLLSLGIDDAAAQADILEERLDNGKPTSEFYVTAGDRPGRRKFDDFTPLHVNAQLSVELLAGGAIGETVDNRPAGWSPSPDPTAPSEPLPGTDPTPATACSNNTQWQGPASAFLQSVGVGQSAINGILGSIGPIAIQTERGVEVQLHRWAAGPVGFGLYYPTARVSVHVRQRMGSYPQPIGTEQATNDWFYNSASFMVPVADGNADWLTIYIRANGTIEQWRRGVLVV